MVLALGSIMDSIASFPLPFITAIEIAFFANLHADILNVHFSVEFCLILKTYLKGGALS